MRKDVKFVEEAWDRKREQLYGRLKELERESETSQKAYDEYWELRKSLEWGADRETVTKALPLEATKKLERINNVSGVLRFFGGMFSLGIFIFLLVTGLWIAALLYGFFALIFGVGASQGTIRGQGLHEVMCAIFINALLVSGILFGAQFWYTNTPPKTGLATYSVTMQEKQDGTYAPEGEQFKLVSALSKSTKHGSPSYAWSEGLSDGTVDRKSVV